MESEVDEVPKCFSLAPFRAGAKGCRPDSGATDLSNVSVPGGWVAGLGVSRSAGWFSPPECVSVVKTSLNAASGENNFGYVANFFQRLLWF